MPGACRIGLKEFVSAAKPLQFSTIATISLSLNCAEVIVLPHSVLIQKAVTAHLRRDCKGVQLGILKKRHRPHISYWLSQYVHADAMFITKNALDSDRQSFALCSWLKPLFIVTQKVTMCICRSRNTNLLFPLRECTQTVTAFPNSFFGLNVFAFSTVRSAFVPKLLWLIDAQQKINNLLPYEQHLANAFFTRNQTH